MGYQLWICQPVERRRQNQGAARPFICWLFPKRRAVNACMGHEVLLLPQLCAQEGPQVSHPYRGHLLSSDTTRCVGINFTPLKSGINRVRWQLLKVFRPISSMHLFLNRMNHLPTNSSPPHLIFAVAGENGLDLKHPDGDDGVGELWYDLLGQEIVPWSCLEKCCTLLGHQL